MGGSLPLTLVNGDKKHVNEHPSAAIACAVLLPSPYLLLLSSSFVLLISGFLLLSSFFIPSALIPFVFNYIKGEPKANADVVGHNGG